VLEVVGRHLKARRLRCIAAFARSQCFLPEARRLDSKFIST
jgi:hypothetical protein